MRDGRLMAIVDAAWVRSRLPDEDIAVPLMELPEVEPDNGNNTETLTEQEQRWTDLALGVVQEQAKLPKQSTSS